MTVELQHIVPDPLATADLSNSQIWNSDLSLSGNQRVLAQATSGKGKSTLLNIIYGTRIDYSGTVLLDGEEITKQSNKWWATIRQTKLSMVFQDLRLFAHLTGRENIEVKRVLTEHYPAEKIAEMADRLGIAHVLDKKAGHMSFGERQRTAIIRAMMQPFELVLLDEPFSHLDEGNIATASALIVEECEKRNAGLIVAGLNDDSYFEYDQRLRL